MCGSLCAARIRLAGGWLFAAMARGLAPLSPQIRRRALAIAAQYARLYIILLLWKYNSIVSLLFAFHILAHGYTNLPRFCVFCICIIAIIFASSARRILESSFGIFFFHDFTGGFIIIEKTRSFATGFKAALITTYITRRVIPPRASLYAGFIIATLTSICILFYFIITCFPLNYAHKYI